MEKPKIILGGREIQCALRFIRAVTRACHVDVVNKYMADEMGWAPHDVLLGAIYTERLFDDAIICYYPDFKADQI